MTKILLNNTENLKEKLLFLKEIAEIITLSGSMNLDDFIKFINYIIKEYVEVHVKNWQCDLVQFIGIGEMSFSLSIKHIINVTKHNKNNIVCTLEDLQQIFPSISFRE